MKSLRLWLLLLLVALLPVRGAMAAAMLCLPQDGARSEAVTAEHHAAGMASVHDHGQPAHADPGASQQHEGDTTSVTSDDCNLCASFCSLTPLALVDVEIRHPQARAALNPALPVFTPSVVSDGERRPPRTI